MNTSFPSWAPRAQIAPLAEAVITIQLFYVFLEYLKDVLVTLK